jgi:hypothetical protein
VDRRRHCPSADRAGVDARFGFVIPRADSANGCGFLVRLHTKMMKTWLRHYI